MLLQFSCAMMEPEEFKDNFFNKEEIKSKMQVITNNCYSHYIRKEKARSQL